jgi:hypothetical protein
MPVAHHLRADVLPPIIGAYANRTAIPVEVDNHTTDARANANDRLHRGTGGASVRFGQFLRIYAIDADSRTRHHQRVSVDDTGNTSKPRSRLLLRTGNNRTECKCDGGEQEDGGSFQKESLLLLFTWQAPIWLAQKEFRTSKFQTPKRG